MTMPAVMQFNPAKADVTPTDFGDVEGLSTVHEIEVEGRTLRALVADTVDQLPTSSRGSYAEVVFERTDDGYVVEEPGTGTYGEGDTPDEAFRDLIHALLEYRDILARESPNLSSRLATHLQRLLAVLGPSR